MKYDITDILQKLPTSILMKLESLSGDRDNARELLSEHGVPSDKEVCDLAITCLDGIHKDDREQAYLEILNEIVELVPTR